MILAEKKKKKLLFYVLYFSKHVLWRNFGTLKENRKFKISFCCFSASFEKFNVSNSFCPRQIYKLTRMHAKRKAEDPSDQVAKKLKQHEIGHQLGHPNFHVMKMTHQILGLHTISKFFKLFSSFNLLGSIIFVLKCLNEKKGNRSSFFYLKISIA